MVTLDNKNSGSHNLMKYPISPLKTLRGLFMLHKKVKGLDFLMGTGKTTIIISLPARNGHDTKLAF